MSSQSDINIVVVKNLAELQPFLGGLRVIKNNALEPNVFYEPWMLVPALTHLAPPNGLHLALMYQNNSSSGTQHRRLTGFFPLEIRNLYNHFPVSVARLWKHNFCYLCTPLLHRHYGPETLNAFLNWLRAKGAPCSLLEFGLVSGEGPVHDLLVERLW